MKRISFASSATLVAFSFLLSVCSCNKTKKQTTISPNPTTTSDTLGSSIELWGATTTGGLYDSGMIFKINGDGSGFDSFYSFSSVGGLSPHCTFCKAGNGKLYGTTLIGGAFGQGTVFSFDPVTKAFKKLTDFTPLVNGSAAVDCHLSLASNGKIYGANFQYIFCIDPATDQFTVLYKDTVSGETLTNVIVGDKNNL